MQDRKQRKTLQALLHILTPLFQITLQNHTYTVTLAYLILSCLILGLCLVSVQSVKLESGTLNSYLMH